METAIKSNPAKIYISHHISTPVQTSFWKNLESNRFAIIPILLVVTGCLGALSASFGAEGSITKLAIVAFPTSIATSLIIGLAPMKVALYASALAIVVDLIFLVC